MKAIVNYPEGKPPTSHTARFYIERKRCISGHPTSMIFGAAVLAPHEYNRPRTPVWIRVGRHVLHVPAALLGLTRPFNRYIPGVPASPWPSPKGTS